MQLQTKIISDQTILSMIAENNMDAWGHLYDKYAAAMYGIICNLTDDRSLAELILKEAFIQLKEKQILSKATYSICPYLLRHTHTFARQQLNEWDTPCSNRSVEQPSLLNMLCSQDLTIKQAASNFNISEEEAKKKLHIEFIEIRLRKKEEKPFQHQQEFKEKYASNLGSNQKTF